MDTVPEEFARAEFLRLDAVDWIDGAGRKVAKWRPYIRKRWIDEQSQRAERATRRPTGSPSAARSVVASGQARLPTDHDEWWTDSSDILKDWLNGLSLSGKTVERDRLKEILRLRFGW